MGDTSSPHSVSCSAHQGRGVLVRPEGLWDGPVSQRNACLRVGPHIDELVATVPRLQTEGRQRTDGIRRVFWKKQQQMGGERGRGRGRERGRCFTDEVKKPRRHCGAVVRQHLQSPHSEKVVAGFSGPGAFLHVPRSPSLPGFSAASPASSQRPKTCTLGLIGCQSIVHRCNCDAHLCH